MKKYQTNNSRKLWGRKLSYTPFSYTTKADNIRLSSAFLSCFLWPPFRAFCLRKYPREFRPTVWRKSYTTILRKPFFLWKTPNQSRVDVLICSKQVCFNKQTLFLRLAYADNLWRPFALLLFKTFLPDLVAILFLNPCTLDLCLFLGW